MQTILIVEDDKDLLEQLVKATEAHYKVFTSSDIKSSISILEREALDGLIIDYRLPDGTAKDLLDAIKPLNKNPKSLIMTAHAQKKMVIEFLNRGVTGFIEKPFLKETFQHFILEHLPLIKSFDGPVLCDTYRKLTYKKDVYPLTEIEYQILRFFFAHTGKWVQRKEIIQVLWGDVAISRNILDTHLSNLKNKIPYFKTSIKNLRGRGYIYERTTDE